MPGRQGAAVPSRFVAERRLPLSWIIGATAVALLAAGMVVLAFNGDGSTDDEQADGGSIELTPEGDVPDSVHGIALAALDGGPDRILHEFMDGKPVVVNFFGSWCQPCLEEMPDFQAVYEDLGDQVSFVGIANQDTNEKALDTVEQTGVTYPAFNDPNGAAFSFFEGLVMPTTVFMTAEGEVLEVHGEKLSADELRDKLREHFAIGA